MILLLRLQKDVEFHDVIYKSTNNLRLIQMLNNHSGADVPLPSGILKDGTSHQKLVEEHEAVIEAAFPEGYRRNHEHYGGACL